MKQAKLLNANERKRLTAIINHKRYPTRNRSLSNEWQLFHL
jgi:hypothetical protein